MISILLAAGCMMMTALEREDTEVQNRVAQQIGIQPLVQLLRLQKTSHHVLLSVIRDLASLCIGERLGPRFLKLCNVLCNVSL